MYINSQSTLLGTPVYLHIHATIQSPNNMSVEQDIKMGKENPVSSSSIGGNALRCKRRFELTGRLQ